ncbi:hypothetical protein IG631_16808 [Alternaria alternata]|nr:hypothetical protein IG631_16808 [Alternaria alternata]
MSLVMSVVSSFENSSSGIAVGIVKWAIVSGLQANLGQLYFDCRLLRDTLGRHGRNLKCQIRVGIGLQVSKCVGHGRDHSPGVCKCGHRTGPVEELLADVRPERVADPVHPPRE